MALTLPTWLQAGWRDRLSRVWRLMLWLGLLLMLARLLYLPSSERIAASDQAVLTAPPNTSIVLEGVGQPQDATVLTLEFDDFDGVQLQSLHATLDEDSRVALATMGAPFPPGAKPDSLTWNIRQTKKASGTSLLRIEVAPAAGANMEVGTSAGMLQLRSDANFALTPTPQDYGVIDGYLKLGQQSFPNAPDLVSHFQMVSDDQDRKASVAIGSKAKDVQLLLGDPLGYDDGVPVRAVALIDESGQLVRRLCGAPAGEILLWSTLFQPRLEAQPRADLCRPNYLTASQLTMQDGALVIHLSGSALIPGMSLWAEKLKANWVLWGLLVGLIAIPGDQIIKTLKTKT